MKKLMMYPRANGTFGIRNRIAVIPAVGCSTHVANEIAKAVEELFGVKVEKVNTVSMKRKPKRLRYSLGYTAAWKKAIVKLTADSKGIEFFEGMN